MRKDFIPSRLTSVRTFLQFPPTRIVICLVIALLVGALLGLLQVRAQGNTYDPWFNGRWAVPLWFPFVLGVVESMLVIGLFRRGCSGAWLSAATGSLTWIGMTAWWWPIAAHEDALSNASCLHRYCHVSGVEGVGMMVYILIGMVLILSGTVLGSFLLRLCRPN